MSTSKHTFDQVKSILGKLDRSIDDARARRLDTDRPVPAQPAPVAAPVAAPAGPVKAELAQARPLRATPNYGAGANGFRGRADHPGI